MKKIMLLALVLAGCGPKPGQENRQDETLPYAKTIIETRAAYVEKICESGRALYIMSGNALVVVDKAPECQGKQTTPPTPAITR